MKPIILKYPFDPRIKKIAKYTTGIHRHEEHIAMRYARDFLVPVGTEIVSPLEGIVIGIKKDSSLWGREPRFAKHANYLVLDHENGIFTEYVHLAKDGISVEEGDRVYEGQPLAYTGLSGQMSKPHLHMNTFRIVELNGIKVAVSIPMIFVGEKYRR